MNDGRPLVILEFYGNTKCSTREISKSPKCESVERHEQNKKPEHSLKKAFREVFLPQGYPESVTIDYVEYQLWDTLQAFCSSVTGALATEAVLKGVGVGDSQATALAATTTWLLKDGAGMVGRIVFAWMKGTELDCFSKQWRLMADLFNDIAIFIDFLAPYFKPIFTLIVCLSSCCRALVGVAGGATRAALTQHQARRNNLADVSAKDGSQETLVNLSALLFCLVLVPLVSGHQYLAWCLFLTFTCCHVYANYRAVRSLQMNSFNENRFRLVVRHYFETSEILSVREANRLEPLLPKLAFLNWCRRLISLSASQYRIRIIYGARVSEIPADWLDKFCSSPSWKNFFVCPNTWGTSVMVCLKSGAGTLDMLMAAFEAELLARNMETPSEHRLVFEQKQYDEFLMLLNTAGWNLDYCLINFSDYRYSVGADDCI